MLSLVVPYINRPDLTRRTIEIAFQGIREPDTEIIAYGNGATDSSLDYLPFYDPPEDLHRRLSQYTEFVNRGILHALKRGVSIAQGDLICFIHNDVLIWEEGWDSRIVEEFERHPRLGLAGFVGGQGVAGDGGRIRTMLNMQGKEWGKCPCHEIVADHHGERMEGFEFASVLDACVMIYQRGAFQDLLMISDALHDHRPPNHWYDRNIPLTLIDLGWQVGVIGIPFDHFSANTGHQTISHQEETKRWAQRNNKSLDNTSVDQLSYDTGKEQFEREWAPRLPCRADNNGNYTFGR